MTVQKRDDDDGRLKVGDRVQLSELGRRHPRIVDREGVIVGVSKSGMRFRVLWDGLKLPAVYHHSYLERAIPSLKRVRE